MEKKPLKEVLDNVTFNAILADVTKTRKDHGDGRTFTYEEVTREWEDKSLKVMGRHFPLDKVFINASGSCNVCNGKGYYYNHISKLKYPDPSEFLLDIDYLPKSKSDEDQKKWQEEQSKISTWKVLCICPEAARKTIRKNPHVCTNQLRNIWITVDYEFIDKE